MPILEVQMVIEHDEILPDGLPAALANATASIFGAAPGNTWVRLTTIPTSEYAEDGGGLPEGVYPIFVSVLKARVGSPEQLQDEAARLTKAIAAVCKRPAENVHIIYEQGALGRVSFGGRLLIE